MIKSFGKVFKRKKDESAAEEEQHLQQQQQQSADSDALGEGGGQAPVPGTIPNPPPPPPGTLITAPASDLAKRCAEGPGVGADVDLPAMDQSIDDDLPPSHPPPPPPGQENQNNGKFQNIPREAPIRGGDNSSARTRIFEVPLCWRLELARPSIGRPDIAEKKGDPSTLAPHSTSRV
ncbi:uncharacterized protein LOC143033714 [Oratosquilla oratoria]|uniref:uncharacterized protein LOC143033714 n=1 Tax=Oratosquilla oratoria TaxID=337810 RepID=UPI003F75B85A